MAGRARPLSSLSIALLALPFLAGCAIPAAADPAAAGGVEVLDQRVLRREDGTRGIPVGGLSEIAVLAPVDDTGLGRFLAISDDRGEWGPPRALRLDIHFDLQTHRFRILDRDWQWLTATAADGVARPDVIDGEALRYDPSTGHMIWSSEGWPQLQVPPGLYESTLGGELARQLPLPAHFMPDAAKPQARGIRPNKGIEALDLSPGGRHITFLSEFALAQDQYPGRTAHRPILRVVTYDRRAGRPVAEHGYRLELQPDPQAPGGAGGTEINGAVSILLLGDGRYLVLERGFWFGYRLRVRLYLADPTGAEDLLVREAPFEAGVVTARKWLVSDLIGAGLAADNWEGMAFGPDLPDGRKTLILVTDDNFNQLFQSTIIAWIALPPLGAVAARGPAQ
ncbi:esterase-like activity of phytase family protein [Tistrella mobilis]|uniref:esterase-like activity of phytase family protein n=1 Tax=Tistrella mobilis TaxID=171437 RepID=UPI0035591911